MNVTDPLINPLISISLCYRKKVHDNKEFSRGNSNLVVNHESRPIKSNSIVVYITLDNLVEDSLIALAGLEFGNFQKPKAKKKYFLGIINQRQKNDPI